MDPTVEQWNIPQGAEVIAADGDKVGKVIETHADYLVVEKGFFFPTDYYVPTRVVSNYDGEKVYLSVTKDEALHQGWDVVPDETVSTGASVPPSDTTGYATERGSMDNTTRAAGDGTLRVPVHEEELTATKRPVERGQVRIDKNVVAEEQTLEVPVTEERVTVQRRTVDRDAAPDATAFQEGTIEVPVRGEEVDLQKRTRVAEEIEVGKDATQSTQRVAGTVRREEVHIDDAGLADNATSDREPPA